METVYTVGNDSKPCFDIDNTICRCCFSTNKKLLNIVPLNNFFLDLFHLNVTNDGLPPWLCYECSALLVKSIKFKHQVHKAHNLWYEYINRCAPVNGYREFPAHAQDSELKKYSLPRLTETETLNLTLDSFSCNTSTCEVYYHKKNVAEPELTVALPLLEDSKSFLEEDVKEEGSFSDYDDNITLDAYRSITKPADELSALLGETELEIKEEAAETKKKKKSKKTEPKEKRKKKKIDTEKDEEDLEKKSVRRPVEVDETKVEIITLEPEDHMRQLKEELETATLKFPFHCALCYKGFNFQVKLDNHMKKHSPARGRFTCGHCSMHFPSAFSQRVHMFTHTRRYKCKQCEKIMRDPVTIMQHVRSQHEGITDVFACEICGKISTNSKTHRGHLRNRHAAARPACARCGRSFVNAASLQEHEQIHEGVKNFACAECGKRFRTRTQVRCHQLAHSELRAHYCVECDVRFKSAQSLKQHLQKSLRHVDKNTVKPRAAGAGAAAAAGAARAQCARCGRWLGSLRALRRHARAVHEPARAPRHACPHCRKAFMSKSVLVNHVRTHTGERPFACARCGRRFSQRTAMLTHAKLVHKQLGQVQSDGGQAERAAYDKLYAPAT